jgi:hypothetical protein
MAGRRKVGKKRTRPAKLHLFKKLQTAAGRRNFVQRPDLKTLNMLCTCAKKLLGKNPPLTQKTAKVLNKYKKQLKTLVAKRTSPAKKINVLRGGFLG